MTADISHSDATAYPPTASSHGLARRAHAASGRDQLGLLARCTLAGVTLPFAVFLTVLVTAVGMIILLPRARRPFIPGRGTAPSGSPRGPSAAAAAGACTSLAIGGPAAGLTGTLLAGPSHRPSPALTTLAIFPTFGAGVLVQTITSTRPAHRLAAAGITPVVVGLCLLSSRPGHRLRARRCS